MEIPSEDIQGSAPSKVNEWLSLGVSSELTGEFSWGTKHLRVGQFWPLSRDEEKWSSPYWPVLWILDK